VHLVQEAWLVENIYDGGPLKACDHKKVSSVQMNRNEMCSLSRGRSLSRNSGSDLVHICTSWSHII